MESRGANLLSPTPEARPLCWPQARAVAKWSVEATSLKVQEPFTAGLPMALYSMRIKSPRVME